MMDSIASALFGITLGLNSAFLLWIPNASAETDALGPLAFFLAITSGSSSR